MNEKDLEKKNAENEIKTNEEFIFAEGTESVIEEAIAEEVILNAEAAIENFSNHDTENVQISQSEEESPAAAFYSEGENYEENDSEEEKSIVDEILDLLESGDENLIREELDNYHDNDIAAVIVELSSVDRIKLYRLLGTERMSDVFSYLDDVSEYLEELGLEQAADVIENMDADDAVDVLEDIEDEETRDQILSLMEPEATEDILLISSYDEDEIGSRMTTNYVSISKDATIKQAMRSLVEQAGENDNINTIYVYDEEEKYYGAIDLRDLIVARKDTKLEDIISTGYPSVDATEKISENIEELKSYAEDSIPVLNEEGKIIGVFTSTDVIEAVEDEMSDDYAKLAGLTEEADIDEKLFDSMKKRLPWLALLLVLGIGVSTVVGLFESIVTEIAIIVSFQSLILDMAGNVGTQSLAVTIRVLMDENISGREKIGFVLKEMRVGATNGFILGSLAFIFVGAYIFLLKDMGWIYAFSVSGCVGLALLVAMAVSSFVGASIPMILQKLKFDPAVASGPLITTMNDLVAVVTYYGMAKLLLIDVLHL